MEGPSQDSGAGSPGNVNELLQLILLDFGLAEELTPTVRRHFISLLHMIGKGACSARTFACAMGVRHALPRQHSAAVHATAASTRA